VNRRWLVTGLMLAATALLALFFAGPDRSGSPSAASDEVDATASVVTIAPLPPLTTLPPPTTTTTTTTKPPTTTTTRPPAAGTDSCRLSGDHEPSGGSSVVPGETDGGNGTVWDVRIEIEDGLSIDAECFADAVIGILADERGWGRHGDLSFRRADGEHWDFKLILASPELVDRLCAPINTGGEFSCRNGNVVAINLDRWEHGAAPFGDDLLTYRRYLINHETGHRLGHSHVACGTPGGPAPVMMQQSKTTGACLPNGWPLDGEL
jgi:Protein of unknown function (DUF3152)